MEDFSFFIAADQPMEFNKCGTGTTKVFSFSGSGLSWRSGLKLQDDVQLYFPSQIWGIYLNPILTKNNLSELLQSPSVFKIKYPKIEYFIYSRNRIDNVRLKRQTIRLNIYLSMCNVKWMSFNILHCSRQSSILLKLSKYSISIVKRNILIILDFRSTPPDFRGFQTNLK